MAPIFASPDIAAIVAAFPPPLPTSDKASLVANATGDRFLHSSTVVARFRKLLQDANGRIPTHTINSSLDLQFSDWLFTSQKIPLMLSANRQEILSDAESQDTLNDLKAVASKRHVDVSAFAAERDIALGSLAATIAACTDRKDFDLVEESTSKANRLWMIRNDRNQKIKEDIGASIQSNSDQQKTNLSSAFGKMPKAILLALAEQVVKEQNLDGLIRSEDKKLYYIPPGYDAMIKAEQAKELAREFSKILVQIHRHGYHSIPDKSGDAPGLHDVFLERTKAGIDDGSFSMIHSGDSPIAIAFTNRIETVLTDLQSRAIDMLPDLSDTADNLADVFKLDEGRITKLVEASPSPDFAKLLMQDAKYRKTVEDAMASQAGELEAQDMQRFSDAFSDSIRLPTQLYFTGLDCIQDHTLKQRLDAFVLEFLRKELLPSGLQHLREQKLLRNKVLSKEIDRFNISCIDAKNLADLQSTLAKFVRKQKLESLSLEDELKVKTRVLQVKVKTMKKMTRASDILQNLIWLSLAQKQDGLFISSGKDTTRMIKQYQAIGNAELGKSLEQWKDKFKAGKESAEDIEQMRDLAEKMVAPVTVSTPL